jgi:hypothetical protein
MAWKFFANDGSLKSITSSKTYQTIGSSSSVSIANNSVNLITGTNSISTAVGGKTNSTITLVASGQATGVPLIINNGTTKNSFSLRGNPVTDSSPSALGIYAGESVTFQYNGIYWVEINRNLRQTLDAATYSGANITISSTSESSPNTIVALSGSWKFDGNTYIELIAQVPAINYTNGTMYTSLFYSTDNGSTYTSLGIVGRTYTNIAAGKGNSIYTTWRGSTSQFSNSLSYKFKLAAWFNASGPTTTFYGSSTNSYAPISFILKRSF